MDLSAETVPELTFESLVFELADKRSLDTQDMYRLTAALLAEKKIHPDWMLTVAELFTEHVLDVATFGLVPTARETQSHRLLKVFLAHPSLTTEALDDVMGDWLDRIVEEGTGRTNPDVFLANRISNKTYGHFIQATRQEACSVAMLGTFWRVASALLSENSQTNILNNMIQNKAVPPPLVGYAFQQGVSNWRTDIQEVLGVHYPDLADLPVDMLVDVAANDKFPVDWFTNKARMPEELRWFAPNVPAPVPLGVPGGDC